ncbi:hypothetical protein Golomagni_07368 [Golovinomyces magnicellulatus]|nr:hypothetical protein Golomagni_07368 [Golovinomyces magnicellulatus]
MSTNAGWFISPYFDRALFSLPPSPEPLTVVPPAHTISIMHPFNISSRVYQAALDPRVPISLAIAYVTVVENLNRYNTSRGGKPWRISRTKIFTIAVLVHNIGLAVYSAWSFYGLLTTIQNSFVSLFGPDGPAATLDSLCRMHGPPGLGQSHFFNSNTSQWEAANTSLHGTAVTLPDETARGRIWNEGLGYYGR